ncbi:MAG: preprotein translocase subunit YajC [Candidatus Cloacimonetes bacterium]|jgi:preprotein translocase subunit YajC|nr:preprotein translocase subunit YajC [Candidatus Cloacimonadota bacterium]MDD2505803.1 preprotein translocase subunit YajC [Candidatus Cloacimonadota bacterium]MDD4147616.1 preprotein translocase subunit YajC [Candidatus Cloacimonadota bacterium]MDD4559225.1 preprotein translocase subunit YajC [Candidatus Cloacimonadota bacterium]
MQYILLQAKAGAAQGGSMASSLIFFVALFAIMYFLMIRPQQKRQKEMQKMLDSLQVNDKVLTSSGIYGRVVSIKPDKNIVVVEIDDTNNVRVDFQRAAIVQILNVNTNVSESK